ncbi:MAG: hypothetical protein ACRC4W_06045 [Treponemataceae bacterium]
MPKSNHRQFFKDFVTDEKLLQILAIIEDELGYQITAEPMSEDHSKSSYASIAIGVRGAILLYPSHQKPAQETLCHELMHVVLWLEGYNLVVGITEEIDYIIEIKNTIASLVLHQEIWKMTKELGFNEEKLLDPSLLINQINNHHQESLLTNFRTTSRIAQALLSPISKQKKEQVCDAAVENIPRLLEKAVKWVAIISDCEKLTPQAYEQATSTIIETIINQKPNFLLVNNKNTEIRKRLFSKTYKDIG